MPSLRDQFHYFYVTDEAAVGAALTTGLVAPDTNVLLNLYRFQSQARDQLFGALEKVGDRLWIPHQVGLEFYRRRLDVMKEQEGYFIKTRDDLVGSVGSLHGRVRAFGTRISLDAETIKKIDDGISKLSKLIVDEVMKAEGQNEVRLGGHASDEILARIETLFENRVGVPMASAELEEARKEAQRRIKEKIPPGYMDKDKADPSGDYLVWRQLKTEAVAQKVPVILVTDDRKEDWYRREHGLTLGARQELRQEMMNEAGVPFIIMTTGTFLHYAETYLNAEVSDETIAQAKELPELTHLEVSAPALWTPAMYQDVQAHLLKRAQSGTMTNGEALLGLIYVTSLFFKERRENAKAGDPAALGEGGATDQAVDALWLAAPEVIADEEAARVFHISQQHEPQDGTEEV
jgi:hypothetical protein